MNKVDFSLYKKILLLILLPFVLAACSDEPEQALYHLTLGAESDAEVAMGVYSAEVTVNGYARWIDFGVVGDFQSCKISDDIPEWLTLTTLSDRPNHFRVDISELKGTETRVGQIGFTVIKGSRSQSGAITITQNPCTLEDFRETERRAMKKYLSKFDVVNELPELGDIQVGSVAPFYKLDTEGTVYMQVVRMGTGPSATQGEMVAFRFMRYDLLYYLQNGVLPKGQGNANDLTQDVTSFRVDYDRPADSQWGIAVQMPILLGLPVDSEVNLVVASESGPVAEISDVIPFLYNIRYYKLNS